MEEGVQGKRKWSKTSEGKEKLAVQVVQAKDLGASNLHGRGAKVDRLVRTMEALVVGKAFFLFPFHDSHTPG